MKEASPNRHPIILDTDIGYDPDDTFALLFLHKLAKISLIVTANETPLTERAQFTSTLLESLGSDVPIASGRNLDIKDKFIVSELIDPNAVQPKLDAVSAMREVIGKHDKITYIGIGGFSNLADYLAAHPSDTSKLQAFVMGGALDYERYPGWIEYNIKIDQPAAKSILGSRSLDLTCIMAQTTHNPIYEVVPGSHLYELMANSSHPAHQLIAKHCDAWYKHRSYAHGTLMHDPLTVATALGYDFASIDTASVRVNNQGTIVRDPEGVSVHYSRPESRATDFMNFLYATLAEEI